MPADALKCKECSTEYPLEARFYDHVRKLKRVFYIAKDARNLNGPWVAVYKL